MKRILLCLMVALFATGCLFAKNNDEKMNVMSYNIRYDNSGERIINGNSEEISLLI